MGLVCGTSVLKRFIWFWLVQCWLQHFCVSIFYPRWLTNNMSMSGLICHTEMLWNSWRWSKEKVGTGIYTTLTNWKLVVKRLELHIYHSYKLNVSCDKIGNWVYVKTLSKNDAFFPLNITFLTRNYTFFDMLSVITKECH